ncbi:MAG: SMC family ATPase [Candidatus Micrarchaeota archaeon]
MINSIHLINWRSHSDTKLIFRKGTNLLVGIMGAGKSSILEGISFALFGTFPAIERRKLKTDNLVRFNEPSAKVVLEFEWSGSSYRVERTIERGKRGASTTAEIYKNNTLIEHGQSAVTIHIQNLIGVDYDLFTRAIYSEQNNLDHFLNLDPRRRREEIDALLGLDRFETARANVVTVINQLRSKQQTIESKFTKTEMQKMENEEKQYTTTISTTESKLNDTTLQIEQKSIGLEANVKKFENLKKEKELFEKLDRDLLRFSTQVDLLKKELGDKKPEPILIQELEKKSTDSTIKKNKLLDELKTIEQKQNSISKELGSIENTLKNISQTEKNITTLNEELKKELKAETIASLTKLLDETKQNLLGLSSDRKSVEREISEINELVPKLKEGISKCPLCLSDLDGHSISHIKIEKEKTLELKNSKLKELSKSITDLTNTSKLLDSRMQKIISISEKLSMLKIEPMDKLNDKKQTYESDLIVLTEQKKQIQINIDKVSADLDLLRQQLKDMQKLLEKQKEWDQINNQLSVVKEKLSSTKFDLSEFDSLRSQTEEERLIVERLLALKKSLEAELRTSKDTLKIIQENLSKFKLIEEELLFLSKLGEELLVYKNALLETQTSLRLNLIEAINNAMNEIWLIFYPYKNYHALRLGVSEKDYIFEVHDGHDWKALETMASGGERACAALALRVAFAMVLTPNLSWLILDEPTHNLDTEAVALLSSALQYKVPEVVNQTFVITHDEALMGSEFASSYRLDRDKTNDGVTKIENM